MPMLSGLVSKVDARDVLGVAGIGLLFYGCWLVWPPAAFIVTGVILVGVAVFGTR